MKMKRTRAERNPLSKLPSLSSKARKKSKPNPKPVRARKPDNAGGGGGSPAAASAKEPEEEYLYPTAEGYLSGSKEVERLGLGFGDGEDFGLWSGSVEEEVLLGWFPWAGPVLGAAEDEEEGDFDIWHLQQIHEIPSTAE